VIHGGALEDVLEIDRDRALTRDERRQNRGEGHDDYDPDPYARAIVAKKSLSLLGIEHRLLFTPMDL
jgi:hypothetical protein